MSYQEQVFGTTELLEMIVAHLSASDLLLNVQLVSQNWNATVTHSPTIQKFLFRRASPKPLTDARYEKNLLVALTLPEFFSTSYFIGNPDSKNPSPIDIADFQRMILGNEAWLRPDASWRDMHVAQPPITTLRWHVLREDERDYRLRLPGIAVEFKFPRGLRVEEYYDLLLGTTCQERSHYVWWPERYDSYNSYAEVGDETYAWLNGREAAADRDGAILVEQRVHDYALEEGRRDKLWNPSNLEKFHKNLVKFEIRENVERVKGIPWSFATWNLGSNARKLEAMKRFLRAALTRCTTLYSDEEIGSFEF
ncbi:hypothetical protein GGR53DRAFT_422522 [Hypoxylon sp. FL1150]|nr:hypothetical protein GGR53DRAFT_422522 [Hypoxylon sp. FL1150]